MEKANISNQKSTATDGTTEVQRKDHFSGVPSLVLLVEDNRISAKIAKSILSGLHCRVDTAMDGRMALEYIEKNHYDLIFIDIGLPDMAGDAVTRRIRSSEFNTGKHVPIIGLTAYADPENQQQCLDSGMNAIIVKPLRMQQAETLLSEFIPNRKKWEDDSVSPAAAQASTQEAQIVDFEYAKGLVGGNEQAVQEMLVMLADSLPYEIEKLQVAYQEEDWEAVQSIAHKLSGGASYCGTLRLKSACSDLDSYIQSGLTAQIPSLYKQMLAEVKAFQKFMREGK